MRPLYTLCFFIIFLTKAFAQIPPPCSITNPPLAKFCNQACILCDLDGYTSMTTQTSQGQILPGFCTQVVHSMGYIGFVAGSSNLTIQVTVGACTLGNSIEMGIYQSDNCQTFKLVSDCNTAMFTGNTYFFSNTEPLVPGCPYFLVFDNNGPASCSFTVSVINGSATAPAVGAPDVPDGPTKVCPGATTTYTINELFGACQYQWTAPPGTLINGKPSPVTLSHEEGTTVTVTWGNQGGQLCVKGSNPCSMGPQACLPVMVAPIPPTILPTVYLCPGESFEWLDGNAYQSSQLLSFTYETDLGCDSVVQQQLIVRPPNIKNLGVLRLCEGDCLTVGNNNYCSSGFFQEILVGANGCDSTVVFSLVIVEANAVIAPADTLSCLQDSVLLDGSGSTAGSTYLWKNSAGMVLSNEDSLFVHLAGTYQLIIERMSAGLTCRDTAQITVVGDFQYPVLSATADSLTCANPVGAISATSSTPDVTFLWSGPGGFVANQADTVVSTPGDYIIQVVAPNGCSLSDTVTVVSDIANPDVVVSANDTLDCVTDSILISAQSATPGVFFHWTGPQGFESDSANTFVSSPGAYSLVATAPNGCTAQRNILVPIDTLAPTVAVLGDTLTCFQPGGTLTAQFAPSNASLLWSGPQNFSSNLPNPAVNTPGAYLLQVSAANGCSSSATALVLADTLSPQISTSGATLTCTNPAVPITVSSTTTGTSFLWSGPGNFSSTEETPSVNVPGNFSVVATGTNGCTASAVAVVIADTLAPQLTTTGDTLTCLKNTGTVSVQVSPAGSAVVWEGPQNFSSTLFSPTVSVSGTYTATATAPNGCTASAETTVETDASIPLAMVSGGILTCLQTSLMLNATVSPAGSTLMWTGPQNFTSNLLSPTVTLPGTYTLLVSTPNGCSAQATAEVAADTSAPGLVLSGGTISCAQPNVVLGAATIPALTNIIWTGPQNFTASGTGPTALIPGTYTAVATASNGCSSTATVVIPADTVAPLINAIGGALNCLQTSVTLTATVTPAGSAVLWSGPQNFSATVANPATTIPGAYSIVATAANGCTAMRTVDVSADTLPPVVSATGGTISCAQPNVVLGSSVVPGNASLVWSGPAGFSSTQNAPQVNAGGMYALLATATNGCTATTTVSVAVDTMMPMVSVSGGLLTCVQNTLALSSTVSPAGSSLQWTGPSGFSSGLPSPVISVAGNYVLVATAQNGCTGSATAVVTADSDFPQLTVSGGTITCSQSTVTLAASFSPSDAAIMWTGPQNFSSTLPAPQVVVPGTYTLTAVTNAGCTATATAVVQIDTLSPQLNVGAGLISCAQPAATLNAVVQPAGSTVQWQGPQGFTSALPAVSVTLPGTYTVVAVAGNGCSVSVSTMVTADTSAPVLSASGGQITCTQPGVQLALSVSPGNSTLLWSGPQNFSATIPNPTVAVPGLYLLTATAPNGCTATVSAQVTADVVAPQVTASGGTITCSQPAVSLSGAGTPTGGSLLWSGPQNFSSTQSSPQTLVPGLYTLQITLPNGCTGTAVVTVSQDVAPPNLNATATNITCRRDTAYLDVSVAPTSSTIQWSGPQNFTSSSATITTTLPGTYSVTATASNGCTATKQVTVEALDQPTWTLSLGPDIFVEEFEPVFPHPITDLLPYEWEEVVWSYPSHVLGDPCTTCALPVIKLAEPGTVSVQLTDSLGCTQTASYFIDVQQTSAIYVPNIFAPEGQAGNQRFELYIGAAARAIEVRNFQIFDRWGNLVHERPIFQPNDPEHGWDGRRNGELAQTGVYVWHAEISFANGRVKLLKGDVTLYR